MTYDSGFFIKLLFSSGILLILFLIFKDVTYKKELYFEEMVFSTLAFCAAVGMVVSIIGVIWTL